MEGQWEVAISEISYPSMYQNITEESFKFFGEKRSKSATTYNLEPVLYTSISDIVAAMNTLIQERNNLNETCITVKVSRGTQKVEFMLANDTSNLALGSTDLGYIFGNNVGNEFGVLMIRKGPHEPEFAYDIVRIHSLMIYSDIIEFSNVGDTKVPLLRCFLFISMLEGGHTMATGQYMNYQTFSNLQFRPLLKKFFHRSERHLCWKNTLCICRYHSACFDVLKGVQHSFLTHTVIQDGCFKTTRNSIR